MERSRLKTMKVEWDALTEEKKEAFFTYFLHVTMQEIPCSEICVHDYNPGRANLDEPLSNFCLKYCAVLFPNLQYEASGFIPCPCHIYGKRAAKALKTALRKDGWIP